MEIIETYTAKTTAEAKLNSDDLIRIIRTSPYLSTALVGVLFIVGRYSPIYVLGILLAAIFFLPQGYDFVKK